MGNHYFSGRFRNTLFGLHLYTYAFSCPKQKTLELHGQESRNQLAMGIPMALQFAITASGTMVMQSAINLFGSDAVASFTAASKVQNW